MEPKFVTTPEKKVIGMSTRFISILSPKKNNFVVIPKLWGEYMKRSHEIQGRLSPVELGICTALPESSRTDPDECFYMAGTEVKDFSQVPEGMETMTIPPGRYAVFTQKGKLENIEFTMNYIYGSWLSRSGEKLREAPDLEVYDHRFKYNEDDSELEIWIPVA